MTLIDNHNPTRLHDEVVSETPSELITLGEMERRYVRQVLTAVSGNKTHAARILGIDRRSLYRRLEVPRDTTELKATISAAPDAS